MAKENDDSQIFLSTRLFLTPFAGPQHQASVANTRAASSQQNREQTEIVFHAGKLTRCYVAYPVMQLSIRFDAEQP